MSRRKRARSTPDHGAPVTVGPPLRSIGTQADLNAAKREGEKAVESKVDAAIDQVRADAQALETAAKILDNANTRAVPRKAEVMEALFAMATGMRIAADRMPGSSDIPF